MDGDLWSALDGDVSVAYSFELPVDPDANLRRVKAVATVRPILDLDRTKSQLTGDFWELYDLVGVAATTIDRVALAMGISSGLSHADTVAAAVREAARQQPDRRADEHRFVADRVVEGLLSKEEFTHIYADAADDAESPTRRKWGWRLLYEQWAADETVYIRASEPAITVLLNALDIDPDSAQAAAEFQIRYLVDRGMYETAVGVAGQARLRTAGFLERVRRIVRDTLLEPEAHDWVDDVPRLLDSALAHVSERISSEGELLDAISERRDTANTAEARIAANQLISVLGDCRARHLELQRHLMGARPALRRAQDDRFASPLGATTVDIERDLLDPALRTPIGMLVGWAVALEAYLTAPARDLLPELSVLIDEALTARPDDDDGTEAIDVDDLNFAEDEPAWWLPYWDLTDGLLTALTETVTLSQLCARARDAAESVGLDPTTAAVAIGHIAYALLATPVDFDAGLIAVDRGTSCTDPAIRGRDLTITRWVDTDANLDGPTSHRPAAEELLA